LEDNRKDEVKEEAKGEKAPATKLPANEEPKPETGQPPAKPMIGNVYNLSTDHLKVDPSRFQFKLNTNNPAGVTAELRGVKNFNPDFAGVISVWRDPDDGHTYIVNGHHRFELAQRTGHPHLAVRYIEAANAKMARAKGAEINMAEGRGTAVDAAKFLRDSGQTPEDLQARGISLSGKLTSDAAVLTRLNDQAFDRVARGSLDADKAIAVARHLSDPNRQERLFSLLAKREDEGKDLSNRTVEELARQMASAPATTKKESTLWGEEATDEDTFVERAELAAHVRSELAKEQHDFGAVASERRASKVAGAGNTLNVEENKRRAEAAEHAKHLFDMHANLKGKIADALDSGSVKLKQVKTKKERENVRTETLKAIHQAIEDKFSSLDKSATNGKPEVDTGGDGRSGEGRPERSGIEPSVPTTESGRKTPANTGRRGKRETGLKNPDAQTIEDRIHQFLQAHPRTHLRVLHKEFGGTNKKLDHTHPVNQALVRLRDSGRVQAHEPERGEPSFSATSHESKPVSKPDTAKQNTPPKTNVMGTMPAGYKQVAENAKEQIRVGVDKNGDFLTTFAPDEPEKAAKRLGPAIINALKEAKLDVDYKDGLIPLGYLAHLVKQEEPATDGEIMAALTDMRKQRAVEAQYLNEVQKLPSVVPLGNSSDPKLSTLWDKRGAAHYWRLPPQDADRTT